MEPDLNALLAGLFAQVGGGEPRSETPTDSPAPPTTPPPGLPDLSGLQALLPLVSRLAANPPGEHVALLRALKPYLPKEREKRVDEAIELLQLARFLPLIAARSKGEGSAGDEG